MKLNSDVIENIVYIDYSSTSLECFFCDDSSRPDSLSSMMRDNVVILTNVDPEEKVEENQTKSSF